MSAPASVDVVVVGGGVCGVLAGQRLQQAGFSFRIVEKRDDYGGVWAYRANEYSHLQAHAALYQWHNEYKLDENPFKKCPGSTVLQTLRRFADAHELRQHTLFKCEVLDVTSGTPNGPRYIVTYSNTTTGVESKIAASALFVCSGILGEQYHVKERNLPGLSAFSGKHMFAGKTDGADNFLSAAEASGKHVVILGSGAFGLEAMEAAHRAQATSITLVTRARDRWIVPYARQFKFIAISHAPFLPRTVKCWLMRAWLGSLYEKCGIEHMAPPQDTLQSFTGQCNDAFFAYPKKGLAKFVIDDVSSFNQDKVELRSGYQVKADILVIAIGHHVQYKPAFLRSLKIGPNSQAERSCFGMVAPISYTCGEHIEHVLHADYEDLHNFAFFGKNPYIGTASDWVWFNVPHGPEKQIHSFITALQACRAGHEEAVKRALKPTPFNGCKGESMNAKRPSGLQERKSAYWRTLSAALRWYQKPLLCIRLQAHDWGIWALSAAMALYEAWSLRGWLR